MSVENTIVMDVDPNEKVEYTEEGYWKAVASLTFLPEEKRQAALNAMMPGFIIA